MSARLGRKDLGIAIAYLEAAVRSLEVSQPKTASARFTKRLEIASLRKSIELLKRIEVCL